MKHKKIKKAFKLFPFLIAIFTTMAVLGTPVKDLEQTYISIRVQNAPITAVLQDIEGKTNFSFSYSKEFSQLKKKFSLNHDRISVREILETISKVQPIDYQVHKMVISVKIRKSPGAIRLQEFIRGRVIDAKGLPLPGATILLKGTNTGVVTDLDGNFTIEAAEGDILQISFMGYTTQEITVGEKNELLIELAPNSVEMDELVIIGYGSQRRALVTNAVSKIEVGDDNVKSALSPTELIEGRAAGVMVTPSGGGLGTAEKISIRGAASISGSNEPLYVVDGIPLTNTSSQIFNMGESLSGLSTLNLDNIESIEILKDAASAAIYGSRANNGVVLITTKRGNKGSSLIDINYTFGLSEFPNKDERGLVDSDMYIMQYNEGIRNYNQQYGLQVGDRNYKVPIRNPFEGMPDTDWLDLITQVGQMQKANISFSGGSEKTTFYLSGSYLDQTGIIKTNSLNKVNISAKINHEVKPWLEVGSSNNVAYLENNQIPGTNIGSTIIGRTTEQRPFDRPYKPNGDYYIGGTNDLMRHNPVQILNEQEAYLKEYRYLGNIYSVLKGWEERLQLRSSLNADMHYVYDYTYYNENHPYGAGGGRVVDGKRFISNTIFENVLSYNDKFGGWEFDGMLGNSFLKVAANTSNIDGRGFPSPAFDVISVASEIAGASGNINEYAIESYFGRFTTSYLEKYVFNATLRTDGSSKFAPDTRWGWFPSVSVGWNVSEEDFLRDSSTNLKLRMSYGRTGNQDGISSYAYQPLMSGGRNYRNESGIAVTNFGNPDLTWEIADQYDFGFDLSLFHGKLSMMADVYLKKTSDLLYSRPVHATSGATSITSNIGSMENKGVEFTLNSNLNLGPVRWYSSFNFAHNQNEITSLLDGNDPISIGGNRALQVGNEIGAFYLFVQDGIFQYDGEVPQEQYDLGIRAGDVKWLDVDGNNIINDNDRKVIGSSSPKFFGGWNNSFSYAGFQLDINTSFMYGNDVYAAWKPLWNGRLGSRYNPVAELVENRWTGPGTTNRYPRAIDGSANNHRNSDRWLEDGSFFRLRTVKLSYRFQREQIEDLGLNDLQLYVQGDNVLLFSNYSGWDPQVNQNMDPRYFGVDSQIVPRPRSISVGASINL